MFSRLHFWPNLLDTTIRPNKESHPEDSIIFAAHKFFLPPRTIGFADLLVFVRNQCEGQIMLGNELAMLGYRIATHPQQNSIRLLESSVFITERAYLCCSARGVVLGIKKQDKVFSLEILECGRAAAIGGSLEVRGLIPLLKL